MPTSTSSQEPCSCWRCWFQSNFTPLTLLSIVLLSFIATVALMHEEKIDDKYVTWLEGFCMGAMTSLAVSLKGTQAVSHTSQAQVTTDAGIKESGSASDKTIIS